MITKEDAIRLYRNLKRRKRQDDTDKRMLEILENDIIPSIKHFSVMKAMYNEDIDYLGTDGINRLKLWGFAFVRYDRYTECIWNTMPELVAYCRRMNPFKIHGKGVEL